MGQASSTKLLFGFETCASCLDVSAASSDRCEPASEFRQQAAALRSHLLDEHHFERGDLPAEDEADIAGFRPKFLEPVQRVHQTRSASKTPSRVLSMPAGDADGDLSSEHCELEQCEAAAMSGIKIDLDEPLDFSAEGLQAEQLMRKVTPEGAQSTDAGSGESDTSDDEAADKLASTKTKDLPSSTRTESYDSVTAAALCDGADVPCTSKMTSTTRTTCTTDTSQLNSAFSDTYEQEPSADERNTVGTDSSDAANRQGVETLSSVGCQAEVTEEVTSEDQKEVSSHSSEIADETCCCRPNSESHLDLMSQMASLNGEHGLQVVCHAAEETLQPGDIIVLGDGAQQEFRGATAIVTNVAETYCTTTVLDECRHVGIGECWPYFNDVSLEDTLLRLDSHVTIFGMTGAKTRRLNGLTGCVSEHPQQGHPIFIRKPNAPGEPRLVVCIVFDDSAAAGSRSALVEPRFLRRCELGNEEDIARSLSALSETVTALTAAAAEAEAASQLL